MIIALIFAGGTGQRMNTRSKPKQFLSMHGKPVLIYTLEHFQRHEMIDGIILVSLAEWIGYTKELLEKYNITKVMDVIPGGQSGQESIFGGVKYAYKHCEKNSIVLIHDGVRPLIRESTISDCIACVKQKGNAITVAPVVETVFVNDSQEGVGEIFDRSQCKLARAPQCFFLDDIYAAHKKAIEEGRENFIDSASLMQHYGAKLHTVMGPMENIKITIPSDFYIFRALMDAQENLQIMGL